ncbi:DUF3644 domain-containing protein [Kaistella sp. G5-32]|uniref:DUF3644 domain-containing protein n=1 Tax=Kaistella gelatinilytica TaxID=2787636 RepID=A0ABS0F8Y9_9FLAO|nr:DUF3644 domain-containing protein [Kaistella gelatinilytica]MBF8456169.1 DUF3644 domain-containing protein [Kaistella gelatinilytica]
MKVNKTYRSLLDKSINSMLSAIEIYNKPNFTYREETFAILAVNSWELILKAHLLKMCKYKMNNLYILEPTIKGNGQKSIRTKPKLNRANNPMTIGIFDAIKKIEERGTAISVNLKNSIESLVELRDNAIHFHNEKEISTELQELGFGCIKNYMNLIKNWNLEIDLSNYNFYLMPLAYVDSKIEASSITTEEVKKYINFVKNKVNNSLDDEYTVAISIDIHFKKSNSFESIAMRYAEDGIQIKLSEEDIKNRFPMTTKNLTDSAKSRYDNFKQGVDFNKAMKLIKTNKKLCYIRQLDPDNIKTITKPFYSTNIWKELDKIYNKKAKAI